MSEKEKPKSIKDFESYRHNPSLITGISRKEYTLKANEFELASPDTGEIFIARPQSKTKIVIKDERSYIKVYKDSLLTLGSLSTVALKLFTYLSFNLVKDTDTVSINVLEFLELFEYSTKDKENVNRSHYYKAIVELLEKKIVFKKIGTDNLFFINTDVFFNGKREGLYNDQQNRK